MAGNTDFFKLVQIDNILSSHHHTSWLKTPFVEQSQPVRLEGHTSLKKFNRCDQLTLPPNK